MILLINNDGIQAPGLRALYNALRKRCRIPVLALAPTDPQKTQGHALTLERGLHVQSVHEPDFFGFTIDGTACDCVKLGLNVLCQTKPHLVISGINHGAQVGQQIFYSAALSAALEAASAGYSSIAVSQDLATDDFFHSAQFAAEIAHACLRRDELNGHVLNINTPTAHKDAWAETRFTNHSLAVPEESYQTVRDANGRISWHLQRNPLASIPTSSNEAKIMQIEHDHSDLQLLRNGHPCISILRPDLNSHSHAGDSAHNSAHHSTLHKRLQKVSERWAQAARTTKHGTDR